MLWDRRESAATVSTTLIGWSKSPPAAFSRRSETQRTEVYALPLHLLRPSWMAILSILGYQYLRNHLTRFLKYFMPKPSFSATCLRRSGQCDMGIYIRM